MKKLLSFLERVVGKSNQDVEISDNRAASIVGSWRLVKYIDFQGEEIMPHWYEVWSFAAMDDTDTNGVYVCDYRNLHTLVGRWLLDGDSLKLVREENYNGYLVSYLSADRLELKPDNEECDKFVFERYE